MRPTIAILVIVAVLLVLWGTAVQRLTKGEATAHQGAMAPALKADLAGKIQKGMTEEELARHIGAPATQRLVTYPKVSKTARVVSIWKGPRGRSVVATFDNGRLVQSQAFLEPGN